MEQEQAWVRALAELVWRRDSDGRWYVQGSCPKCKHDFKYVLDRIMPLEDKLPDLLLVRCNCKQPRCVRRGGNTGGCGLAAEVEDPLFETESS